MLQYCQHTNSFIFFNNIVLVGQIKSHPPCPRQDKVPSAVILVLP